MSRPLSAQRLQELLVAPGEHAVLDVRDEAEYAAGHLLVALRAPVDELRAGPPAGLVRRGAPVVVVDDGRSGRAAVAAALLAGHGFADVAVLDGGVAAWTAAGRELFVGGDVVGHVLGEQLLADDEVTEIGPEQLQARIAAGEPTLVLDCRPAAEHRDMRLPASVAAPGAELAYRVRELAPDDDTLVVVHCAGRTRALLGAGALGDVGSGHATAALRDGTSGWLLAGHPLERDADPAPPAAVDRAWGRERAGALAERHGLRFVGAAELEALRAERDERALYVVDVRRPEEFARGHLNGAVNVPGGQLPLQLTQHLPIRHARVVLVDDGDLLRAAVTGSWLRRLDWAETFLYDGPESGAGDAPSEPAPGADAPFVTAGPEGLPRLGAPWRDLEDPWAAVAAYLDWERGLPTQSARDATVIRIAHEAPEDAG